MSLNGDAVQTQFSVDKMRMASSWAIGDVNGDTHDDVVIGRVYGDAKGLPGDLKLRLQGGPHDGKDRSWCQRSSFRAGQGG